MVECRGRVCVCVSVCVFIFELAQHMTNLFCDTNQQLHTTTAMPLGNRHSDMLTCGAVPGLAVLNQG